MLYRYCTVCVSGMRSTTSFGTLSVHWFLLPIGYIRFLFLPIFSFSPTWFFPKMFQQLLKPVSSLDWIVIGSSLDWWRWIRVKLCHAQVQSCMFLTLSENEFSILVNSKWRFCFFRSLRNLESLKPLGQIIKEKNEVVWGQTLRRYGLWAFFTVYKLNISVYNSVCSFPRVWFSLWP